MTLPWRTSVVVSGLAILLVGCDDRAGTAEASVHERDVAGTGDAVITAEVWVDNWFSLAIDGRPLIEDSVAYKTERSFNGERATFRANLPMTVAFEFRDFIENDTGLEYIGSRRQQIGDGGAIAQFTNAETGQVLKVTDGSWRCLVIHRAPLDTACENERDPKAGQGSCKAEITDAPDGWTAPDFDDSHWPMATVHSASEVRPKGGYDAIRWKPEAKLIWSKNLRLDNKVLCRATVR